MIWLHAFFNRAPRGGSRRRRRFQTRSENLSWLARVCPSGGLVGRLGQKSVCKAASRPSFRFAAHLCRVEALESRQLLASGGVTYQGGPLINHVAVETVFLGSAWTSDPSLAQNAAQLDQFFAFLTNSSYMDLLAQYGTAAAGPIGHGSYVGQVNLAEDAWPRSTIRDYTIQQVLNSEINSGTIAAPDRDRLLFVFTPPDIVVSQGGARSNGYPTGFAGYHNSFVDSAGQLVRYAVVPDPIGNDQVAGLTSFEQQTAAASHEMAEAITDPDGTSWWDRNNDATSGYEIGDFADLNTDVVYLNNYAVEELWSNAVAGLAAPAGATLAATGAPVSVPAAPLTRAAVASSLVSGDQYEQVFVTAAYEDFLHRAPDAAGLSFWVSQMGRGETDERINAELLASPEYLALHGNDDASWLSGMYQDLLNRPAATHDVAFWLDALRAGQSRFQIAQDIASSPEREGDVIADDYQTYLGRPAAAADVSYWLAISEQGVANEEVIAAILSSPEYYNAKGQGDNTTWLESVFQDLYQSAPTATQLSYWSGQLA